MAVPLILRSHCHSYRIIGSSRNGWLIYLKFFSFKLQTRLSVLYIQLFLEQNSKIKGKLFSTFSWFQCQRVQKTTKFKSISCFFLCQLGGSDLEFVTKVTILALSMCSGKILKNQRKRFTFLCNLLFSGWRCCSISQNDWS